MGKTERMETSSSFETAEFFRKFSKALNPGAVVGFRGPLGSGKTTAIQAMLNYWGIKGGESPTFVMIRTYPVKKGDVKTVVHIDAYRLEQEDAARSTGLTDLLSDQSAVVLIEWAENVVRFLPDDTIWVDLEHLEENQRKITVKWP